MFDFIKNLFGESPKKENTESVKEENLPELDPKLIFKSLLPAINKHSKICIGITTEKEAPAKSSSSKFGGLPHFPVDQEYPLDKQGNPMRLLAQLNFAEIPALEPYPKEGLLQIYIIGQDDLFGCDFDHPTQQDNWRILFFENTDFEARTDLAELFKTDWVETPLTISPLSLNFELKQDIPAAYSLEFDQNIAQILKGDYEDFLLELYFEQDPQPAIGHKVGGYPYFTQNEVRENKAEYANYQLLFQMDSDADKIIWGDVGVANFFITPEDLAKRDFTKVIYNWDCH